MSNKYKTSVVTGGTSGIGLALAEILVARGGRVVLVGRDASKGAAVEEQLNSIGPGRASYVSCDVRDRLALERVAVETSASVGTIDLWINNAGISVLGEAAEIPRSLWDEVIDIDLLGVVNGVMAIYPTMVQRRGGCIVNVASLSGVWATPWFAPYVAAKHGVVGLTRGLRYEAKHHGVDVVLVCPALVDTPIFASTPMVGLDTQAVREALPGKPMDAKKCARVILRGVESGKAEIYPGVAAVIEFMVRHVPFVTSAISRSLARQFWEKKKQQL